MALGSRLMFSRTCLSRFSQRNPLGPELDSGLSLAIALLGDRRGGEIQFDSKPGETRFKVRLPLNRNH